MEGVLAYVKFKGL